MRNGGKGLDGKGGVRQDCLLSPLLFNLLMADLEEEMGRVKWRGGESKRREGVYAGVCG